MLINNIINKLKFLNNTYYKFFNGILNIWCKLITFKNGNQYIKYM